MLITHCHIQNTDDREHVLSHPIFVSAPYVGAIPDGIVECRAGRLTMPPGVVFRVPVAVWAEAGRKQPWCQRLPDEKVEEIIAVALLKREHEEQRQRGKRGVKNEDSA